MISSNLATQFAPCFFIDANSDCTIFFEDEVSRDDHQVFDSITLVSVEYSLLVD